MFSRSGDRPFGFALLVGILPYSAASPRIKNRKVSVLPLTRSLYVIVTFRSEPKRDPYSAMHHNSHNLWTDTIHSHRPVLHIQSVRSIASFIRGFLRSRSGSSPRRGLGHGRYSPPTSVVARISLSSLSTRICYLRFRSGGIFLPCRDDHLFPGLPSGKHSKQDGRFFILGMPQSIPVGPHACGVMTPCHRIART